MTEAEIAELVEEKNGKFYPIRDIPGRHFVDDYGYSSPADAAEAARRALRSFNYGKRAKADEIRHALNLNPNS
jgi:hypothetical protein